MSQENVEIVRRMWDVFAAGSFPADVFADGVEWHLARDIPDTGVCRGPAEIARMLTEGWATVTQPWIRVEEMVEAGDQVVVRWRGGGTGRASGIPMEWNETHVYTLADQKVLRVCEHRDWETALEAVGLRE
jgi:ketosteroid isomerase-like protein